MDPTEKQLSLARSLLSDEPGDTHDGSRLAELVVALYEWKVSGGFLPDLERIRT